MGLELSTSAGPLAGEGRVGEVWEEGRVGGRACDLPSATGSAPHPSCRERGLPGQASPNQPQSFPSPEEEEKEKGREESVGNSGRTGWRRGGMAG